jgi:deoxyribonuclease IV
MWSAPVGDGAKRTLTGAEDFEPELGMLIGAHVSTGGGLSNAIERAEDMRCEAIQIFNQSPRMWKPTRYSDADFAEFREAMKGSRVAVVAIHMIYLINPAANDKEMQRKSLDSLTHALRVGDGIGALGVVVHPGALKDDTRANARQRAVKLIKEALARSESCPIIYENTAGSPQLLGRDFDETRELIEQTGGSSSSSGRLGLCIDSCHLFATGYDIRTPEGVSDLADEIDAKVGLKQLKLLHVNDAKDALGSNRDRHEAIGKGEIGRKGFRAFLGEKRFQSLPAVLEGPGVDGRAPVRKDVQLTRRLWREATRSAS